MSNLRIPVIWTVAGIFFIMENIENLPLEELRKFYNKDKLKNHDQVLKEVDRRLKENYDKLKDYKLDYYSTERTLKYMSDLNKFKAKL